MKKIILQVLLLGFCSNFYGQQLETQTRDNAGEYGANIKSGFFQTSNPINYPPGAINWWHLLDIRHTNPANNHTMQFSGSFGDQELWFRKTVNSASQPWSKILMEDPNGNVGIGTNNPASKLEIADNNGATLAITTNKRNGTPTNPLSSTIDFLGYLNSKKARISVIDQTSETHGSKLSFFVNNGSSENNLTETMTINSSGNVGVGTNNPASKLEIADNNGATLAITTNKKNGTPTNPLSSIIDFLGYLNSKKARISVIDQTSETHGSKLSFFVNNGSSENNLTESMSINSSGNVGIGVNNPNSKLEVNGNLKINASNSMNTTVILGNEENDNIIADNSVEKHYGGGYFFRVHSPSVSHKYTDVMVLAENGNVGIGANKPKNKLDVNGTIHAREVKVDLNGWPDYVFKTDYKLLSLKDVEKHIKEKGHLPDMPSEKEVLENGINLGDNQRLLLQKIEELTLYSIEQNKQLKQQNESILKQQIEIKDLKTKMESLKNLK